MPAPRATCLYISVCCPARGPVSGHAARSLPPCPGAATNPAASPRSALLPPPAAPRNAASLSKSHFHPAAYVSASCPADLPPPAALFDSRIEMLESTDPAALPILRLFFGTLRPSVSPSHPGNLVNHSRAVATLAF